MKKILFMGTPEISTFPLKALLKKKYKITVVTQPDKRSGRGNKVNFSPVKKIALENNLEVLQPLKARDEDFIQKIKEFKPDLIITCAYGQIIPKSLLEIPRYKSVNLHASLLPKLRGASPINEAVIQGFEKTGLTLMYMDSKMDEGNIIKVYPFKILDSDNAGDVYLKMADMCYECIENDIDSLFQKEVISIPQDHNEATYCSKISKEDEIIDWSQNHIKIRNKIRGMTPFPGCYTTFENQRIKIKEVLLSNRKLQPGHVIIEKRELYVGCGQYSLQIIRLQKSGKKEMNAQDFINGLKDKNKIMFK